MDLHHFISVDHMCRAISLMELFSQDQACRLALGVICQNLSLKLIPCFFLIVQLSQILLRENVEILPQGNLKN